MKTSLKLTILFGAALAVASPAAAAITINAVEGESPYIGPVTFGFDAPGISTPVSVNALNISNPGLAGPISGGALRSVSASGLAAFPFGAAGNFWTIGPSDGSPGVMDLSGFSSVTSISFTWGSVDTFNTLAVLDRNGAVLETFTGSHVAISPNGSWTAPAMNPRVTISVSGADRENIGAIRLSSTNNAFEVDSFAIAVPEPGTWLSLIVGLGVVGGTMRKRSATAKRARQQLSFA